MSMLRTPVTWLRLTFRWSNSVQSWHERIGDLVLGGGALAAAALLGLAWFEALPFLWWQTLVFCLACFVPAVLFNRAGWLKIFGPVLYYDMIRQARRSRFIVLRFLYALLLVFLLFCVTFPELRFYRSDGRVAARIAQTYFEVFMVAQFITVVLLTPAYVGGAIAEEKDRKTLEFMLATDLLNREIVLSKLGSRLANLGLVVLTGLPILSVLQFLGGVDPNMVVAGFIVTIMTILGQAGVSIYCSVACKKPREAVSLAYLFVVLYYVIALLLFFAMTPLLGVGGQPIWFGENPWTVKDLVDVYNKGNLVAVMFGVRSAANNGVLANELPDIVGGYVIFHGILALVTTGLAVARLRRVALAQTYGKPIKTKASFRLFKRPAVGTLPMLWKEIHCDGSVRQNWIGFVICTFLMAATFAPAAIIVANALNNFYDPVRRWNSLGQSMNVWLRFCNVIVGCLTLMAVAVRSSTAISNERDKQTMDTLLTTPLDSTAILHAKWIGSILSVRFGMLWLALIWAVGIVTGGLHLGALPFVMASWIVYAAFVGVLGLWFSMNCKTSMRATVMTILMTIILGVAHWLPWMCCGPLMATTGGRGDAMRHLLSFHAGVLTPPFVLGIAPFCADDLDRLRFDHNGETTELYVFCVIGIVAWAVATAVLYATTTMRFRKLTHRESRMSRDGFGPEWNRRERERRRQMSQSPISPWAPPTGVVVLEEVEDEDEGEGEGDADEPLDHDSDGHDSGRFRLP